MDHPTGWDSLLLRHFSWKYRLVVPGAIFQGELSLPHFNSPRLNENLAWLEIHEFTVRSWALSDFSKNLKSHEL
jgi:hypothetical protein